MKALFRTIALLGAVTGLTLFTGGPAVADEINDAAAALQSSNVYIESGVPLNPAEVSNAFGSNSSIAVVAFDGGTVGNNTNWTADQAATKLYSSSNYDTLILVQNGPGPFVVKGENGPAISEILYADFGAGDSVYDEILKDAQAIVSLDTAPAPSSPEVSDGGAFDPTGLVLGAAVLAALGVGIPLFIRRKSKPSSDEINKIIDRSKRIAGDKLNREKERLLEAVEQFRQRGLRDIAESTLNVFTHLDELLVRLNKRSDKQKLAMVQLEYGKQLETLNDALGEDYYIYIVEKPGMWDDPKGRRAEVERAVIALDEQLVNNIQQVNAHSDLKFRVALESLIQNAEAPDAQDMIDGTK